MMLGKTSADGQKEEQGFQGCASRAKAALMLATVNEPFGGTQPLQSPK